MIKSNPDPLSWGSFATPSKRINATSIPDSTYEDVNYLADDPQAESNGGDLASSILDLDLASSILKEASNGGDLASSILKEASNGGDLASSILKDQGRVSEFIMSLEASPKPPNPNLNLSLTLTSI